MAHFGIPKSIPAHSHLSSLLNCVCSDDSLFVIVVWSSTFAVELILVFDVPNVYPFFPLCSHLSRGSRNIINR